MPRADLMSMKKCEDERIYYRNGVLLKNPSRRIEAGSVDRLNEHLVQVMMFLEYCRQGASSSSRSMRIL